MQVELSRLRRGEWIAVTSAAVLLASLLALKWFRYSDRFSLNGWHSLSHTRWLAVVTIAAVLLLAWLQATRRSPALPSTLSMIVTTLGALLLLALIYRVLINSPATQKPGAFIGLAAAFCIFLGGYRSMRTEGIAPADAPGEIETVRLRGGS